MDITPAMLTLGQAAKTAAKTIAAAPTAQKNTALLNIAERIEQQRAAIKEANEQDLNAATDIGDALLDRLALTDKHIDAMSQGVAEVAALTDPIGTITDLAMRPSGIQVGQMRVPLGVVAIIYESRPNVTADAAALCLKSGNASILRGGKEALHSNIAIAECIQQGITAAGLPKAVLQLVTTADRAIVGELLSMDDYIDIIIPRGGKGLIERVSSEAKMPVIKHLHGVCSTYIDSDADLTKAVAIAYNAKTQRYGTCNTMECLLVARVVAKPVLTQLVPLYNKAGVEIRGCTESAELIGELAAHFKPATTADYATEYLAPILSLKIVEDVAEAMQHISEYGSQHTDAIITENITTAQRFLREVDSSSVMVNASSRFADGFEYGLGAEVGISTDKLHARGPVGLTGLTIQKYIVLGSGQCRQ